MVCKHCGSEIEKDSKFCPNCGAEVEKDVEKIVEEIIDDKDEVKVEEESNQPKKYQGYGIAGFVLSLVGIIIAALPCGVLGVTFSSYALKQFDASKHKGKGLAIAGLVIAIIDIVFGIINIFRGAYFNY